MRRVALWVMLGAGIAGSASVARADRGGLLGGVGGGGGATRPSRDDDLPAPPAGPLKPPAGAPAPAADPKRPDPKLEEKIEKLKKAIAAGENFTRDNAPAPDDPREEVARLRSALDRLKSRIERADVEAADRLRAEAEAFKRKWATDGPAIEAGKKPAGMSAADWARRCDEYYIEQARAEAKIEEARERLTRSRAQQLSGLEAAVKNAEERLAWMDEHRQTLTPGQKRLFERDLAWREHQARQLAMRALLRDLEALRGERAGRPSTRPAGVALADGGKTGDWYIDAMNDISRQIALSGRSGVPLEQALDDAEGMPLPEWMKNIGPREKQAAKVRWLQSRLRAARQELESGKPSPDRRAELERDADEVKTRLETESRRLEKMPATRPG